jgi:hypothetical protein
LQHLATMKEEVMLGLVEEEEDQFSHTFPFTPE